MKKSKVIAAASVLLLVFIVGGLIAFFTDTDTKTNTFTVGDVEISLDEPSWVDTDADDDGVPDDAEGLMPGDSVAKDPTITNTGANDAYVYAKVEIPCTSDATAEEIFAYTINSGWYLMTNGSCTNGTATKIYAYSNGTTMTALPSTSGSNTTPALFNNIALNSTIDGTETGLNGNKNVVVTGYAVQTTGLTGTTPSAIWSEASFS